MNYKTDLEQQQQKLATLEQSQTLMKAANKAHRAYTKEPEGKTAIKLLAALPDSVATAVKNYVPRYSYERNPFQPWEMSNNLANIKRIKARIIELEDKAEKAEQPEEDKEYNGLVVRHNYEEDRLQLLFDEKPSEEVRTILKRNGFKWSPRFGAWQRQLTQNAIYAWERTVMPVVIS